MMCKQCLLEGNKGVCDKKDCDNSAQSKITVRSSLEVAERWLIDSGFNEQSAHDAIESLLWEI